ncbi:MAG: SHOCT domain-containing protein [Saprospiraceae bacterium]|nr:SHOCT domain-containing protein [Saprospiraceae bacterium]
MLDKLERLNKLKQSGSITDEEFSIMKKRMFLVD